MFEDWHKRWSCTECNFSGCRPPDADPLFCPDCGCEEMQHSGYRTPQCVVLDGQLSFDHSRMVTSIGKTVRSAQQQEKLYGKILEDGRKRFRRSKYDDGPQMQMKGRIPKELFMQRTRQYGKNFWYAGGDTKEQDRILRREGLLWEK